MIKKLFYKLNRRRPSISYGITVCNEARELETLLETMLPFVPSSDEIIVLQDVTERDEAVSAVLKKYNRVAVIESRLEGDFAAFKNRLIEGARKDFLFQIDADEIPQERLLRNIRKILAKHYKSDCFAVPRINTVEGITDEYIQKWNWKSDERGYINYPDYQERIFRLNGQIRWKNRVHEVLYGYNLLTELPSEHSDYCLLHHKQMKRQIAQNEMYDQMD